MSAEIRSASRLGGNNESVQGTTVGGNKPLHRFIWAQPKIIGIIVLVLGSSLFIVPIAITSHSVNHIWIFILPDILMGVLFIICGILYILTEDNPTKKTVTISLALSIVTILGAFWTVMHILPDLIHSHINRHYSDFREDNGTEIEEAAWSSYYEDMGETVEAIFLFYTIVGAIIFIVMSSLAGAALRSTKSQAIVVMTSTPTETPAE